MLTEPREDWKPTIGDALDADANAAWIIYRLSCIMNQPQPNNPLHGITLKAILEYLVAEYGWEQLGERINIHCFTFEPSINSSLKFLRKTGWAKDKVERLYLNSISYDERHGAKKTDAEVSETGSVWDRARQS